MESMWGCINVMKWSEKLVLRLKVLPAIILFGLTSRSAYYFRAGTHIGLFLFILFALIDAAYIAIRLIIAFRHKENNTQFLKVVFDSAILVIGIIVSCWFQSFEETFSELVFILTCCTIIPAFINNYMFIKRIAS